LRALLIFVSRPIVGLIIYNKSDINNSAFDYRLAYVTKADRFRFAVSNDGTAVGFVDVESFGVPATSVWYFVCAWHDAAANTINIQVNNGTVDSLAWTGGCSTVPLHSILAG